MICKHYLRNKLALLPTPIFFIANLPKKYISEDFKEILILLTIHYCIKRYGKNKIGLLFLRTVSKYHLCFDEKHYFEKKKLNKSYFPLKIVLFSSSTPPYIFSRKKEKSPKIFNI